MTYVETQMAVSAISLLASPHYSWSGKTRGTVFRSEGASLEESGHLEYTRAPTCSSSPRFAFRSMAAVIKVFAVRLKVQLYWPPFDFTQGGEHVEPRSERLVSLDEIS
jgi:hypothetical protein